VLKSVHLVQQRSFGYGEDRLSEDGRLSLAVFGSREAAEAHQRTLEGQGAGPLDHNFINPFAELEEDLKAVTSLSEAEIHDQIQLLGLPAPKTYLDKWSQFCHDWIDWWDELTVSQRQLVRPLFDKLRAFVVEKVPVGDSISIGRETFVHVVHIAEASRYGIDSSMSGTALSVFFDRSAAESYCRAHWRDHCGELNPFYFVNDPGHLDVVTGFAPEVLHDWLLDHGIAPPSVLRMSKWDTWRWEEWWEAEVSSEPLELKEKVWAAFDRIESFNIQKIELHHD